MEVHNEKFSTEMKCVEFIDHLLGHAIKVRHIMVYSEKLFEMHLDDYTYITSKVIE